MPRISFASDETARCFDAKSNHWSRFIDGSNSLSENGIYPQNCSFDKEIKMINPWIWDIIISDTLTLGLSLCPLGLPSTFARKLAMGLPRSETISAVSVAGIELVRPANLQYVSVSLSFSSFAFISVQVPSLNWHWSAIRSR